MSKEQDFNIPDYGELWRPRFHFSTLDSRVNDPNGLVFDGEKYHLYYQCVPQCDTRRGKHWGHATSTDLIHWREEGLALFPDELGAMWSGGGFMDLTNRSGFFTSLPEKRGIIIAYSTHTQHVGIAYSLDGGRSFQKLSTTEPVIPNPGLEAFRDPFLFFHEESGLWKMAIAGKKGILHIFESQDLRQWHLCSTDPSVNTECPALFPMTVEGSGEKKWILSCVGRDYYVGSFDGQRFYAETERLSMQEGPDAYAAIPFANMPDGRTVMISWINAFHPVPDGKWNGAFTVPVDLRLVHHGETFRLLQSSVPELSSLFGKALLSLKDAQLTSNTDPLKGLRANSFFLSLTVDPYRSSPFTLTLCEGAEEGILLSYDPRTRLLTVDRHKSRFGPEEMSERNSLYSLFIDPAAEENGLLRLTLLVDVSNLELFIGDGFYYFVMRIHPCPASQGLSLRFEEELALKALQVIPCRSIFFGEAEALLPVPPLPQGKGRLPAAVSFPVDDLRSIRGAANAVELGEGSVFLHKYGSGVGSVLRKAEDFTLHTTLRLHGAGLARILFRAANAKNYYAVCFDALKGTVSLEKAEDGNVNCLCSAPLSPSVGAPMPLSLQANGTALSLSLNGTPLLAAKDDSYRAGLLALCVHVADATFEEIRITPQ